MKSEHGNLIYHHHHYVALSAGIFLTLSRHPTLSSIAFGRSSGLYPVSAQSCCMYVRAGRPAFSRPCEGVHRSISLTSSSLLLQQYSIRLIFTSYAYKLLYRSGRMEAKKERKRREKDREIQKKLYIYIYRKRERERERGEVERERERKRMREMIKKKWRIIFFKDCKFSSKQIYDVIFRN